MQQAVVRRKKSLTPHHIFSRNTRHKSIKCSLYTLLGGCETRILEVLETRRYSNSGNPINNYDETLENFNIN